MDDERGEATLDRVLELTVLLGRDAAEHLARLGLTESRAHLVWQLQQRGPCTQAVLAADLHVTPRTITALVDGLVATGFVTREPHPSDRRATLVTFTEQGRATAQGLLDDHRRLARQLFGDLPDDVFDGFEAGLRHVIRRFRAVLADREPGSATGLTVVARQASGRGRPFRAFGSPSARRRGAASPPCLRRGSRGIRAPRACAGSTWR
jgi:DNA-binding MarR family transcriptional regulator